MKKILVLVCVLSVISTILLAQTTVPAGPVSGTWNNAGTPYQVQGDISVAAGTELAIDTSAGVVEVEFHGDFSLTINGRLLAIGNSTDGITFTIGGGATEWQGLRFINNDANGQDSSKVVYCTIENGNANGIGSNAQGGAIYCDTSSEVLIENSTITGCAATASGGAIYLKDSDIVINDTSIDGNTAIGGGGIYLRSSDATLDNVEIINNTAYSVGGGVYCHNSSPSFDHVLIADNTAYDDGGGICIFNYSQPSLVNITVANNLAGMDGDGLAIESYSTVVLLNSIIWENGTENIYVNPTSEISIDYTDLEGGQSGINNQFLGTVNWGTGNINADPIFVDAAAGDYNLDATSPCINAGNPDSTYNDPDGSRNDMGALFFYQTGITGLVEFSATGTGNIEDVVINVTGTATATTNPNANGYYYVPLGAGTYNVTATLTGYTSDPQNGIAVLAGQLTTNIDFTMTPILPGTITGTVELTGTGSEADVQISAGDVSTFPYYVDVVPVGYWEYQLEISPGLYEVTATLEGYQDSTYTNVSVQSNVFTTGIDFVLDPVIYYGNISGTISIVSGAGLLADVTVSANGFTTSPDPVTGEYTLNTTTGLCDVTASLDGYADATYHDVNVYPDFTTENVDLDLLPWDVISGTGQIMTVYITASREGVFVKGEGSNQLGAFGPGGLADCRGTAVWVDGTHPLWDQDLHYWPLEGYWYINIVRDGSIPGPEQIDFRLYDSSTGLVYNCYESITFVDDLITSMDQTYPSTVETQSFNLVQNWNWISFNLKPADNTTDVIFSSLEGTYPTDGIYQVKHEGHSRSFDGVWSGDYVSVDEGDGLLVKMWDGPNAFSFDGEKINPLIYPLAMIADWNWIGFLPQTAMDVSTALESIESDTEMIKSQTQSATFTGGQWVGDLITLVPGSSYKVKLTAAANLTFPANSSSDNIRSVEQNQTAYWDLMQGTKDNMILIADLELEALNSDDLAVGVFDEDGNCRSNGKFEGDFWYFTVVGDQENDELYLKAVDKNTGEILKSSNTFAYMIDGMLGSVNEPINIKFNADTPDIPVELSLGQNHPNPFNPSTSISYSLPSDEMVKLSVYNAKGQHVCDLVNEYKEAGIHHVTWDATDYSSGIYFYKLVSGKDTQIKKCLLIK